MRQYKDYPFDVITAKVQELAAQGHRCYQKFSCDKCGNRLGMEEANKFYTQGSCDKCGHITDIKKKGCNFMMVAVVPKP